MGSGRNRCNMDWSGKGAPLDGLILDLGYFVFDESEHLLENFDLCSFIVLEEVSLVVDFSHHVV